MGPFYVKYGFFLSLYCALNHDAKRSTEDENRILDIALCEYSELSFHSVSKILHLDSESAITLYFPGMCAAVSQILLTSQNCQIFLAIELHGCL